eukprot:1439888-Prymnesium_polylepis.1
MQLACRLQFQRTPSPHSPLRSRSAFPRPNPGQRARKRRPKPSEQGATRDTSGPRVGPAPPPAASRVSTLSFSPGSQPSAGACGRTAALARRRAVGLGRAA